MNVEIVPWTPADLETVRALAAEPAIAPQFDMLQGPGRLEHWLADPFCDPTIRFLARVNGEAAGFAYGFLLRPAATPWAMLRIAVSATHRRHGIGARLAGAQQAALRECMPECREISASAYEPCDGARGLAARLGFRMVRTFWQMDRPAHDLAAPDWPAGIVTRGFDGTERARSDWNDAYNASFARHYHFVPSTLDEVRAMTEVPGFDPATVLLAYDGDTCVGFCRNDVHADRGEVAGLGVAPAWQGRGLGRAMLRWGARWLLDRGALPITLLVDGENENALRLYRNEGFVITKTRPVWSKVVDTPGA